MSARVQSVGLNWDDFTLTDNSCKPHPQRTRFPFNLFNGVQQLEASLVKELESDFKSFGRGFTIIEQGALFGRCLAIAVARISPPEMFHARL
jgi:hypothetical protein